MIRVFLAEDEFVVREGIKNNIRWEANGYEFCGEAGDGELAWSMIQKEQPDIVITDIKMPFMDGLTLARHIKAQFPQIEIILLTGYEEFDYAREAVRIGVARYLSKPISGENLLKEVDAIAGRIRERREERESAKKYAEEMRERTEFERQEFFRNLVTGGRELSELLDDARRLELDITALCYNVLLVRVWPADETDAGTYSEHVIRADREFLMIAEELGAIVFDRHLEGKALLFRADDPETLDGHVKSAAERMRLFLEGEKNIRYFGGIGSPVNRITEIPRSYAAASRLFAKRHFTDDNAILSAGDTATDAQEADFVLSEIDPKQIDRQKLQEFLRRGDAGEIDFFLDAFFAGLGKNAMRSTMFRQYIVMDTYFCASEFTEHVLGASRDDVELPNASGETFADADSAAAYIRRIMSRALELREESFSGRYRDTVQEAIRYIEEHYAEEDLTLNRLAAHVNFSPNHLSAVFRQQTGQPFIKYLTDYRMNAAKQMLTTSGKKSSEIGLLVGYRDPHYFSYLFKKTQGMTPTQYREGRNSEETAS
ncbi:MAG: response regulator [Lachnospiraceae bacterium]|nr:response regulator [Lachnospiraceae bacterium]